MTAVFFVETADAGIPAGILVTERGRSVRRAVVYEKNLKVREGLGENAVQTFREIGFYIIYGDNNAKKRIG